MPESRTKLTDWNISRWKLSESYFRYILVHVAVTVCCSKTRLQMQSCVSTYSMWMHVHVIVLLFTADNWAHIKNHSLTKGTIGLFINTDGVSTFKSSLITIWPIYLVIANLPPSTRMLKRNVITCTVWIGNCKLPMNTFIKSLKWLCDRLRSLDLRMKEDLCRKQDLFLQAAIWSFWLDSKGTIAEHEPI